jgi:26S proteasome regulatory subunit N2
MFFFEISATFSSCPHTKSMLCKTTECDDDPSNHRLFFCNSDDRSNLLVLRSIKQSVESRNSVCHSATIYSNALMHAGTTVDTFLRENLDWLSRATNWAKFSATAGLGVIHRGHLQKAKVVLSPYLPQQGGVGGGGSSFPQGGALYALGLIHANHGEGIRQYLLDSLRNTGNEVIQHGACLGLGLAAIGTGDEEIIEELKAVLYNDSAIAGEAAGISMGLVMVGTPSDKVGEMLTYAHNTQHEKIARGLALGVALMLYGCEEEADPVIDQMTRDPDPVLRYGGMYAMAMAYRGTANNTTIRRLLHFAVSDVNDDVQRTAVLALGFVLCSEPEQTPRIVSLLVESYNPHVRYGAAMAIGISCASSGSNKAISLLEPLMTDKVDFVRQGALLGMSMVLLQTTEACEPRLCRFRKQVEATISNKQEETMTKMGAILAQGILNAGGCNVGIMLRSRTGHDRMNAIVGMAVFSQFWFWYPLIHFLSLTFSTMAFIGLNEDLCMPKFEFVSDAKPAMFRSSPPVATPVVSTVSKIKVPAQVLSTSSRVKSQGIPMTKVSKSKAGKTILQEDGCLDLPSNSKRPKIFSSPIMEPEQPTAAKEGEAMDRKSQHEVRDHQPSAKDEEEFRVTVREKGAPVTQKTQSLEKLTEVLSNPTRIIPAQEKFLRFQEGCRYAPLKLRQGLLGFVMLNDLAPSEPVELVTTDAAIFTTTPPITSSAAGLFAETSESPLAFNHDSHRPL